jgi:tetratricopeptide (TPR) repeat protein
MAIVIEAFTVVVRNEAVQGRYPGGEETFQANVPNATFCTDGVLSRVGFMVDQDAAEYLNELGSLGLKVRDGSDAVICDAMEGLTRPSCGWLQVGRYQKACIAWLKGERVETIVGPHGWNPDEQTLTYATKEEARHRLRFLRNEGNVQVFWDTVSGKEVYVGRTGPPLEELFDKAGPMVTANLRNPGSPVDASKAVVLNRAIEMLEIIDDKAPGNWRVCWLLGKAWHALGRSDRAYEWLMKAFEHEKEGNLAVAYLIDGRIKEAETTIQAALRRNPKDPVNQTLQRLIGEVAKGKRSQPKNLFELTGVKMP